MRLAGEFTWDIEAPASLVDIDLAIPKGAMVAVVGMTGSGKSSLLAATLGLMQQVHGPPVDVRGKVRGRRCPGALHATLNTRSAHPGGAMHCMRQRCLHDQAALRMQECLAAMLLVFINPALVVTPCSVGMHRNERFCAAVGIMGPPQ